MTFAPLFLKLELKLDQPHREEGPQQRGAHDLSGQDAASGPAKGNRAHGLLCRESPEPPTSHQPSLTDDRRTHGEHHTSPSGLGSASTQGSTTNGMRMFSLGASLHASAYLRISLFSWLLGQLLTHPKTHKSALNSFRKATASLPRTTRAK